jgi:hypothetical protein
LYASELSIPRLGSGDDPLLVGAGANPIDFAVARDYRWHHICIEQLEGE